MWKRMNLYIECFYTRLFYAACAQERVGLTWLSRLPPNFKLLPPPLLHTLPILYHTIPHHTTPHHRWGVQTLLPLLQTKSGTESGHSSGHYWHNCRHIYCSSEFWHTIAFVNNNFYLIAASTPLKSGYNQFVKYKGVTNFGYRRG